MAQIWAPGARGPGGPGGPARPRIFPPGKFPEVTPVRGSRGGPGGVPIKGVKIDLIQWML